MITESTEKPSQMVLRDDCPQCGAGIYFDKIESAFVCSNKNCGVRCKIKNPCPECHGEMYVVNDQSGTTSFCLLGNCSMQCKPQRVDKWPEEAPSKPKVIIEIRGGALCAAYCNSEIDLILVDWDENEGDTGASAVIIPDKTSEMSPETKRLVVDAVERARI